MEIPDVGQRGEVTVTQISPTGNTHVELNNGEHLNLGALNCEVGDEVRIRRLDEKFCLCLNESLRKPYYSYRLDRMRENTLGINLSLESKTQNTKKR
jgi:hypothetical protein